MHSLLNLASVLIFLKVSVVYISVALFHCLYNCYILKDPKLQQDLERYYKIRAAACRILSIAQNPLQRLDAAKTLLVSHAQLLSCMRLIQREKVEDAKHANGTLSDTRLREASILHGTVLRKSCFAKPGYAQLCLSGIRT